MTVTRRIFDATKRYEFGKMQHLKELFHWDVNETSDELQYKLSRIIQSVIGDNCVISDDETVGGISFDLGVPSPAVTFNFLPGVAIIEGRWCDMFEASGAFIEYEDDDNFIASCTVKAVTVDTPATQYTLGMYGNAGFEDWIGDLTDQISGELPRVKFTSGAESGNTFEIASFTTGSDTTVTILGDAGGAVVGDTFIIKPPALVANLSTQTDEIYLCNVYQEIDENHDADLEDPTLTVTPTKRFASRTFVTLNPDYAAFTGDAMTGIVGMKIGEFERTTPGDTINPVFTVTNISSIGQRVRAELDAIAEVFENKDIEDSVESPVILNTDIGSSTVVLEQSSTIQYGRDGTPTGWVASQNDYSVTLTTSLNDNVILVTTSSTHSNVTQAPASTGQISIPDTYMVRGAISASDPFGTQIVADAFEMGSKDTYRGFNYVAGDYTGLLDTITISPGETFRRGKLYQNPRQLSIDSASNANWIEGTVQTGWNYIYMKPISDSSRTVEPFLSGNRPTINGLYINTTELQAEYGVTTAFCIGVFYKVSTITTVPCVCKNSTIYFSLNPGGVSPPTRIVLLENLTYSVNQFPASLLPAGCYAFEMSFDCEEIACTSGGYIEVYTDAPSSGEGQVRSRIRVPKTQTPHTFSIELPVETGKDYNVETFGTSGHWTLTGCDVVLTKLKFNPLFFNPVATIWTV